MKKLIIILSTLLACHAYADPKTDFKEAFVTPVFKDTKDFPLPNLTYAEWEEIMPNEFVKAYKKKDVEKIAEICNGQNIPRYSNSSDRTFQMKTRICNKAKRMIQYYK